MAHQIAMRHDEETEEDQEDLSEPITFAELGERFLKVTRVQEEINLLDRRRKDAKRRLEGATNSLNKGLIRAQVSAEEEE